MARPVSNPELQRHILGTYLSLRLGMVVIGGVLPFLIYLVGRESGIGLQSSMSYFYWASDAAGDAPSRDWFVGGLFAIGACLYLYKGFRTPENVALNLAALFGGGVAVIPTSKTDGSLFSLHG